jgi:predicted small lipoprotein YifL
MITGKMPAGRLSIKLMIAAMLLCLSILGCGRKEMPSAPRQVPPQPVTDLRVQLNGDQVELTWSFSKTLSGSEPIKGKLQQLSVSVYSGSRHSLPGRPGRGIRHDISGYA